MSAVTIDLEIEQGTTWAHGWAVTYNGTPIDATWAARAQARLHPTVAAVLHQFIASVDSSGNVVIAVTPAESSTWAWRNGVYDVEVDNGAGVVLRVAQGRVTVSPEVTR